MIKDMRQLKLWKKLWENWDQWDQNVVKDGTLSMKCEKCRKNIENSKFNGRQRWLYPPGTKFCPWHKIKTLGYFPF